MTRNHLLACVQGDLQNFTRKIGRGYLVNSFQRCSAIHAVESKSPFKRGTGPDHGSLEMDVFTSPGSHLSEHPIFAYQGLVFCVNTVSSCMSRALGAFVDVTMWPLAEAISGEHRH